MRRRLSLLLATAVAAVAQLALAFSPPPSPSVRRHRPTPPAVSPSSLSSRSSPRHLYSSARIQGSGSSSGADVRISTAKTNDDVLSLADLRYREWMADDPDPPNPTSFRLATAEIYRERDVGGSVVFLARVAGAEGEVVVGAAELSPIEFSGVLTSCDNSVESVNALKPMYVTDVVASSSHRRLGVGTKLMGAIERQAWDLGSRNVFLHVESDNAVAIRFYERLGYSHVTDGGDAANGGGNVYFSEENGMLRDASRSPSGRGDAVVVSVDSDKLAENAGTPGQLLMMKQLATAPLHVSSDDFNNQTSPSSRTATRGGGFGGHKSNQQKKKRKK